MRNPRSNIVSDVISQDRYTNNATTSHEVGNYLKRYISESTITFDIPSATYAYFYAEVDISAKGKTDNYCVANLFTDIKDNGEEPDRTLVLPISVADPTNTIWTILCQLRHNVAHHIELTCYAIGNIETDVSIKIIQKS